MSLPPISELVNLVLISDVSTDAQIALTTGKSKRSKNIEAVMELVQEFKDINSYQSLKRAFKKSSKYRKLYDDWVTQLKKDRENNEGKGREEINSTIFNNFVKLREHISKLSSSSVSTAGSTLENIFANKEIESNLNKLFVYLTNKFKRGTLMHHILRDIPKEKRKPLYKLYVNNIPEEGEPTVNDFLENSRPIYNFGLAELSLAEPSGKETIEGWEKGEKNISGRNFETWRKVFPSSDSEKYSPSGSSKTESSQFIQLVEKIGNISDDETISSRIPPLLPRILLGRKPFTARLEVDEMETASSQNVDTVKSLTAKQIEEYFNILMLAGKVNNKGSKDLYMRTLNNQRISKVIHFPAGGKKVASIRFVKGVLTSPNNDSIFENAAEGVQVIPAMGKKQFTAAYSQRSKNFDADKEGTKEALDRDYERYLNNKRISQSMMDIYLDYDEIAVEKDLEDLSKVGDAYHAVDEKGINTIRRIERNFKQFIKENPEEIKPEDLGSAEKAEITPNSIKFAIERAILTKKPLSDLVFEYGNLDRYYSKLSKQYDIIDCFIMAYYLVVKVAQSNLDSEVEKIDSIMEEEGEALSLTDPTLEQAVSDLSKKLLIGLKKVNTLFKKELKLHLNYLIKNKESYSGIFSGETFNLLKNAGIFKEKKQESE